jgi:hypothetical protein
MVKHTDNSKYIPIGCILLILQLANIPLAFLAFTTLTIVDALVVTTMLGILYGCEVVATLAVAIKIYTNNRS